MNDHQAYGKGANTRGYKPPLKISSESEFLALMEDIDRELASEGVKITARPFMAGIKITERYNVVLDGLPPRRPPKADSFEPLEVSIRVRDWIEKRYGKKLNVPFRFGRVVLPLRGDLYIVNCPVIFGKVQFVCEPDSFGEVGETLGVNAPPICNMVDLIEDLTPDFAYSLSAEEVIKISVVCTTGIGLYLVLHDLKDTIYINEVMGDFDAAVFHLMEHQPKPGLSKWATLQAVEKLIKAFITHKGDTVKRIHSLEKLAEQAAALGLPKPPGQCLADIQCSAGVRYGEVSISVEEAVKAHVVSLELGEYIAQYIGIALKRNMPPAPKLEIDGMPLEQFLKNIRFKSES